MKINSSVLVLLTAELQREPKSILTKCKCQGEILLYFHQMNDRHNAKTLNVSHILQKLSRIIECVNTISKQGRKRQRLYSTFSLKFLLTIVNEFELK